MVMYLVCKGTIKRENYKTKQEFYFFVVSEKQTIWEQDVTTDKKIETTEEAKSARD